MGKVPGPHGLAAPRPGRGDGFGVALAAIDGALGDFVGRSSPEIGGHMLEQLLDVSLDLLVEGDKAHRALLAIGKLQSILLRVAHRDLLLAEESGRERLITAAFLPATRIATIVADGNAG